MICRQNDEGVTLIELLVVLGIIAIVALGLAVVGPDFSGTDRVRNTSRELLSDLQWARQSAMTQGPGNAVPQMRGAGIRFEPPDANNVYQYRLFRFNDTDTDFTYDGAGEERGITDGEGVNTRRRDIHPTLELQINSGGLRDPANDILVFDRQGIPRASNWAFSQITFVIQNPTNPGIQAKCVTVSFNRIREGEWDGSNCQEQ
jgi:prepilin-type N-terminal cleavage/methylation domain-containing protein